MKMKMWRFMCRWEEWKEMRVYKREKEEEDQLPPVKNWENLLLAV